MGFADVIEEVFGEEVVPAFGEACELLEGDCVLIEGEGESRSFLYVGTADDLDEYPVITGTRAHVGHDPHVLASAVTAAPESRGARSVLCAPRPW
jgi:hypothetical protein